MRVFKFGGASLKNAAAIRNMAGIVKSFTNDPLMVVVSAMGKTTDALESILNTAVKGSDPISEIGALKKYHVQICTELFASPQGIQEKLDSIFGELLKTLKQPGDYDQIYDQVVSQGEVISSVIVEHYLKSTGIQSIWIDARKFISTDRTFREGKVQWKVTTDRIQTLQPVLQKNVVLTQGFIGSTDDGFTTTLGREGSDFTAAIFASCLQAESVTIWKDVPGVMSADPKRLPNAVVFSELPFKEAAEMTYYGASVIHPKTIQPLALKQIPLLVKSFDDVNLPGTKIHECHVENLPPLIVFKEDQCLISCKVTDYTFVNEQQLSVIFDALSDLDIKLNLMQNSAISFSFCIDFRENKVMALIDKLQHRFEVYYNTGLTLITVKNYNEEAFTTYRKKPGVMIEQSSRSTLQVLLKL
ncbi:MAG TPA: aspartate kinase [Cyclobacteriaceae bacterium]|nr:aspartate kinase [Cyclobacteriaceae bacterium]